MLHSFSYGSYPSYIDIAKTYSQKERERERERERESERVSECMYKETDMMGLLLDASSL